MRFTFAVVFAALMFASPAVAHERLEFRGQAIVPTGTTFAGTTVGGLSSITYDERRGVYYTLSDDPSQFQPARFYTVGLDVRDGRLTDGDVQLQERHDAARPRRRAVPGGEPRPRGSGAHQGPAADPHLRGLPEHA